MRLAAQAEASTKATKILVAGNRITASGAKAIGGAVGKCEARISELDLSRNSLADSTPEGLKETFSELAVLSRKLATMCLGGLSLSDESGVSLCEAVGRMPPTPEGKRQMLTKIDLHHNHLGPSFAKCLPLLFERCNVLAHLDLSRNSLGVGGGVAVASALASTTTLKTLDLSNTNLCNCTPNVATAARLEWSGDAIAALDPDAHCA